MRPPNADRRYVRRLCHDVLQRAPRPAEERAAVGLPVADVARHFTARLEACEQWLEEELDHHLLLDRFRPRTPAIEGLPERLRRGATDVRAATAEILLSTGFSLRNPGNDTFVTVVLEQCLGIRVQDRRHAATLAAGRRLYDGQPARFLGEEGRTQADVVRIAVAQPAFARHLLERHHRRLFGAGLDDGAAPEVERVARQPGDFFAVLAGWLASARYVEACAVPRPRTERQWVRSLYGDVFERAPTYEELRQVQNALRAMADPGPLRAVLVRLLLGARGARLPAPGPDGPDAYVRACFDRYLGRAPSQRELDGFTAALREPGTDPALVVRALLTSAEYGLC